MRLGIKLLLIAFIVSSSARAASQDGTVAGTLDPPGASAEVSALRDNVAVATVKAEAKAGKFRLALEPGNYTIMVSAPVSSFPVRLENVVVKSGETTTLSPVLIVPGSGKAVLSGRIIHPRPDSEIRLLYEGKERASARADQEGRYEFRELPAGRYEVQATAPGHASDRAPVTVPENQRVEQTAVLLPVAPIDGVDWAAGKVRATGIGSPPQNAGNAAAARAMTERAAMAEAQRNLLRTVEQIKVDGDRTVRSIMQSGNGALRIQGYLKGYTVVSERELGDGRIEVILELPLTGPAGLSRYLAE